MTSGGLELKSLAVKLRAAYRCQWEIGHGVTTSVLELWVRLGASEGNSETVMHTEAIQIDLSPMKRQQGIIEAGQKKKKKKKTVGTFLLLLKDGLGLRKLGFYSFCLSVICR